MSKTENTARILVQVHPGAKKNQLLRLEDGVWHVKIAVPPVEGRANRELIEFLSENLDVSKSRISIEKGSASRRKVIQIEGLAEGEAVKRIQKAMV